MATTGMSREQYEAILRDPGILDRTPGSSIDWGAYNWWKTNYKPTTSQIISSAFNASPLGSIYSAASSIAKPLLERPPEQIIAGMPASQISPVILASMTKQGALPQAGQPLTPQTSLSDRLSGLFPDLAKTGAGALAGAALTYIATRPKGGKRRKKSRSSGKARTKKTRPRRSKSSRSKPKPGTKAWMTYIRGKRKKHGRSTHRNRK